ncbi:MAG TPA: hypothetical protein VEI01_02990 [Terriglobales bacterium]|nr:hypothetical protein [Terriglobales bacterium]
MFGLNRGIITDAQYSYLVATVIASAVIPTMVANEFFLPRHLLYLKRLEEQLGGTEPRATTAEGD